MNKHKSVFIIGITVLCIFMFVPFAPASLIENGSFEFGTNPPTGDFQTLPANNTGIDSWDVSAGQVDWINTYWEASDGNLSLDLAGIFAGTIEQSFPTSIGQEYSVSFDMAGNPGGLQGTKELRVEASGQFSDFSFDTTGKALDNMGWVTYNWQFEATDTTTMLSFRSLQNYGSLGPALDNEEVVATPIPGAAWLLGSGLLSLIGLRRKLKK